MGDFDTGGAAPGVEAAAQPTPSPPPQPREPESAETGVGRYQYVVQVGTFRDRNNAERTLERLGQMGYQAVIRTFSHQTIGSMYSVQIRQIEDFSIASALVAEIERSEKLKPVILKVRAAP